MPIGIQVARFFLGKYLLLLCDIDIVLHYLRRDKSGETFFVLAPPKIPSFQRSHHSHTQNAEIIVNYLKEFHSCLIFDRNRARILFQ